MKGSQRAFPHPTQCKEKALRLLSARKW